MQRLTGKVAIVTGASAGIGRATAKLFAAEGAKVVIAARREAELETLAAEIVSEGGEAAFLAGDVQSEDFAKALVALAVSRFGRLDIAYNNAGTLGEMGPTTGVSEAGWSAALATNLTSAFLGAKHQIPEMLKQGGGSIIFTSTFVGYSFAFPGHRGIRCEQGRIDRFDAGARRRVWTARCARQRHSARRRGHTDVSRHERHRRVAGLRDRVACAQAGRTAGRTRPLGALSRVR